MKTGRRRSLVGEHGPQRPSGVAHSRSKGSAVIPFDRAGEAQVSEMLHLAEDRGVDFPTGFELDAIQLFYTSTGEIDELRAAGFDLAGRPWQASGSAPLLAWRDHEAELLPADSGRRHFSAVVLDGEPLMLALLWDVTGMKEQAPATEGYLTTSSSAVYHAVRDLIARAAFGRDAAVPWPSAGLETRDTAGEVLLVPVDTDSEGRLEDLVEQMWQKSRALSDLDADVLDALLHSWMAGARSDDDDVVVAVDDILRLRGLAPKRNARGYGAGFHPKQRRQVVDSLFRLQALWLDLVETPSRKGERPRAVRSRALLLTDQMGSLDEHGQMDVERVVFRPGRMFGRLLSGPGRRVAKLPRQALEYDPYRFAPEKRLVRYLSWQWRIRAHAGNYLQPYRVETLLNAIGIEVDARRPTKMRERFEAVLDHLHEDQVLAQWQYEGWNEPSSNGRGWWRVWLEAKILLEPPPEIVQAYRPLASKGRSTRRPHQRARLEGAKAARPERLTARDVAGKGLAGGALAERLAQRRKELGWSQLQLAEQLDISRSYVSALEAGRRPSAMVARRIERWLAYPI